MCVVFEFIIGFDWFVYFVVDFYKILVDDFLFFFGFDKEGEIIIVMINFGF